MPTKARRVCRAGGCGNVTAAPSGYCEQCAAAGRNDADERRRSKKADPFYLSPEWRRFRRWYLNRHPLCGCGAAGQMVDHVVPISRGGAKLDERNAQTMCWRCHNRKTGGERSGAIDGGQGWSKSPCPSR